MSIPVVLAPKDPDDQIRAYLGTKGAPFTLLHIISRHMHHFVPLIIHALGLHQNAGGADRSA
jgi:hypothetical protein